jgi:hypothetical protein
LINSISEAPIGGMGVPRMILHVIHNGNKARRLYAAARKPEIMIEVEVAGHLSAWESGAKEPALKALVASTSLRPGPAGDVQRGPTLVEAEMLDIWKWRFPSFSQDCWKSFSGDPLEMPEAPQTAISRCPRLFPWTWHRN